MDTITDDDGDSPTTYELHKVLKDLYDYCFANDQRAADLINAIDAPEEPRTPPEDSRRGVHKYLRSREDSPTESRYLSADTSTGITKRH